MGFDLVFVTLNTMDKYISLWQNTLQQRWQGAPVYLRNTGNQALYHEKDDTVLTRKSALGHITGLPIILTRDACSHPSKKRQADKYESSTAED